MRTSAINTDYRLPFIFLDDIVAKVNAEHDVRGHTVHRTLAPGSIRDPSIQRCRHLLRYDYSLLSPEHVEQLGLDSLEF